MRSVPRSDEGSRSAAARCARARGAASPAIRARMPAAADAPVVPMLLAVLIYRHYSSKQFRVAAGRERYGAGRWMRMRESPGGCRRAGRRAPVIIMNEELRMQKLTLNVEDLRV